MTEQEVPAQASFEQRLTQVKEIIDAIETGKLPLEDSVRRYEQGIASLNALEAELNEMKRRITILQQKDGTLTESEMGEKL